jgi:hypothetical protein
LYVGCRGLGSAQGSYIFQKSFCLFSICEIQGENRKKNGEHQDRKYEDALQNPSRDWRDVH